MDEGQGEDAGLLWAWRGGGLASPRAASPASEGDGLQEDGGSLGEMMRCLVLLQRWGMLTPEETWEVLQRQVCVRGCGLVLCRSRMC